MSDLELCQEFCNKGDINSAYKIADEYLKRYPNSYHWLLAMSHVLIKANDSQSFPDKPAIAYAVAKRATEEGPTECEAWINFGMAARDLWRMKEARRAYNRGLKYATTDDQKSMLYVNLSALSVDLGRYDEGQEYSEKALGYGDSSKAKANLGFCQLALTGLTEGWENYRACIGTEWRPKFQYNKEPQWDGQSKGTIVVYSEQGLGDMICFASVLSEMQEWCEQNDSKLIVVTDTRLLKAFSRAFPDIEIYGHLGQPPQWDTSKVNYSIPMGQLAEYFPIQGEPYLEPDPDLFVQWRALFYSKKKPCIGIAWTGGIPKTGEHYRRVTLEQVRPLFDSIDAHWVSLQYKPSGREIASFKKEYGIDIVEYPHATLTKDYDYTIGMVAALDAVVGVPTTVIHASGSLGVRTIAMHSPVKCWKFNAGVPYHPVTLIEHNDDWTQTIKDTASHLEDLCLEFSSDMIQDSPLPTTSLNSASSETHLSQ